MNNLVIDLTYFRISAYKSWEEGDRFFNQFNFFSLIKQRKYIDVINIGQEILGTLKTHDKRTYINIHKGTPFYWMGMASFLMHSFTSATFFFDAAVSEDIRNKEQDDLKKSPSILFAILNDSIFEQAARELVVATIQTINEFIKIYNDPILNNKPIDIDTVRKKILSRSINKGNNSLRTISTSLISFFLEWNYRQILISLRTQTGSEESFFIHLFKGCLLFESLLKENPKLGSTFSANNLGKLLPKYKSILNLSNENCRISSTFPQLLTEVKSLPNNMPKFIETTGKIRNTLGHNLAWNTNISSEEYQQLFTCIALSCLHLINKLY